MAGSGWSQYAREQDPATDDTRLFPVTAVTSATATCTSTGITIFSQRIASAPEEERSAAGGRGIEFFSTGLARRWRRTWARMHQPAGSRGFSPGVGPEVFRDHKVQAGDNSAFSG